MSRVIYWMRRDLRWKDNRALSIACKEHDEVVPVFIFDTNILKHLSKNDHRVDFIFRRLQVLKKEQKLHIFCGDPKDLIPRLVKEVGADAVYINEDYEEYAIQRDDAIAQKVTLHKFLDHIVFAGDEIKTGAGTPYKVYTPFKRAWLSRLDDNRGRIGAFRAQYDKFISAHFKSDCVENLKDIGFESHPKIPMVELDGEKILLNYLDSGDNYKQTRDFPALNSTSHLSVHMRFGTVSVRKVCRQIYKAEQLSETWLSQIIWRDFYFNMLQNFPYIEKKEFNENYQGMSWRNDKAQLTAWKAGKTGIPLVDAGMRELNQTGYMQNRVRMVVASFLTKNLLMDWRVGERYFAAKLYDYELAVNIGSWQWASSTGCDAQPYFRVFNPESQVNKFDKDGEYIKKWVPELRAVPAKFFSQMQKFTEDKQKECGVIIGEDYPAAIVDLKQSRIRAIAHFKDYLS